MYFTLSPKCLISNNHQYNCKAILNIYDYLLNLRWISGNIEKLKYQNIE